jgi:hypothetical protein
MVYVLWFRVYGSWSRVKVLEFRVLGSECRV